MEEGSVSYVADAKEIVKEGGELDVEITSNLEYEVVIPEDVTWVHIKPVTKAMSTRTVTLVIDENADMMRKAEINIVPAIGESQKLVVLQSGAVVFSDLDLSTVASFTVRGTATSSPIAMTQALYDENIFAFYGHLNAGYFYLAMRDASNTVLGAMVPQSGTSINPAVAVDFNQEYIAVAEGCGLHWDVPVAGIYRIVLDRGTKKITIYDEANDLKPLVVKWRPNGDQNITEQETPVTKLFLRGAAAGWSKGGKDIGFAPSAADPQVLVYSGQWGFGGRNEFAIFSGGEIDGKTYDVNNSYVFTCPPKEDGTARDVTLPLGEWHPIVGGVDGVTRGSYFDLASPKTIILDLRNMRIYTDTVE